jgi:hypothetical protein
MELEKILSQIKARVGKTDVSDQSIADYVKLHLPDDAEPDEAFYDKAVKLIKSFQGNMSNFAATTVRKQVDAKLNELKNSQSPEAETPKEGDSELLKRLEAIEQALANERKANAINSLRNSVKAKAAELKVANKAIWNDVVEFVKIPDEATEDVLLDQVKKTYEQKLKEYTGNGATPYGGGQRAAAQHMSTEEAMAKREAFKESLRKSGKLPKKEN